jgi:osmoprotectant transport system ATP-binding protein
MHPIVFKNITHVYASQPVLDDLSFYFEENLITAVIGRSGGGKSTLLQIINGLIKPTSGEVFVYGERLDYNNINTLRLNIGYSVQGTGLFPHMTANDNIYLPARITKKSRKEVNERIDLLMDLVDLDREFKNKFPYQLSGGEQQRVGLCRAMILNPKIFLLDEAFAALDPTTRNEIHLEFLKLQKFEPRTIVLVTHDLNEALKLGDRIIILEKGKIQQIGTKQDILNKPANQFVIDFINSQKNII